MIFTDRFELKQVKLISRYLLKVWKIETTVGCIKIIRNSEVKEYPIIWLNNTDLNKFIEIIYSTVATY